MSDDSVPISPESIEQFVTGARDDPPDLDVEQEWRRGLEAYYEWADGDADNGSLPPRDRLKEINQDLRENVNYGEVVLTGEYGVHSFFVPENSALGIGQRTALFMAFSRAVQEICMDPEVVRSNRGEVTPQSIADEVNEQFESLIGKRYFFQRFQDELVEILEYAESEYGPLEGDLP